MVIKGNSILSLVNGFEDNDNYKNGEISWKLYDLASKLFYLCINI
jgi:hypothetical protein